MPRLGRSRIGGEITVTPNAGTPSQRLAAVPADGAHKDRMENLPQPAPMKQSASAKQAFTVPAGQDLRKSAVALFTFLRELVSLRTTVVRNCTSYDRVLWIDEVPRDPECDSVVWKARKDDAA